MDIKDFEGVFKYKLLMPTLYVLSWISMFAGPTFFPVAYQKFAILAIGYLVFKVFTLALIMIRISVAGYQMRKKIEKHQKHGYPLNSEAQDLLYGFIIPNYKEDVEMMAQTLEVLARQRRAKDRYLIFLAMEAHEQGSQNKAYELIERFKGKFRAIDWTRHQIRQFEQKGKASNVSWCAQHLQPIFEKHMIDPQDVMLTIMDADSWAPQPYFDQVQQFLNENMSRKNEMIFQAPQMFTRNYLDVPVFTRVYDLMHSYAHTTQLYSLTDITFPLSNYTLSYEFIKRIGFWDTCPDAIGQDFHTTQKAFWKSGGEMYSKPIYVPFNQVNISTEGGYWADMKARFWQGQRHAQGVADVGYNLKMFFNSTFHWRNVVMISILLETFALAAIVPWVFLSMFFQQHILYQFSKPSPELYSSQTMSYLFNSLTLFSAISYIALEYFKRTMNTAIYKLENQSIFRMLEYPLLISLNIFVISIPVFTIATFKVLFNDREYVVAQKKNTVNKKLDTGLY